MGLYFLVNYNCGALFFGQLWDILNIFDKLWVGKLWDIFKYFLVNCGAIFFSQLWDIFKYGIGSKI